MEENSLFASTGGGGVFLSTDNGTNWRAVNSGLEGAYVSSLAASRNEAAGMNLCAGTEGGGIFRTSNKGATRTAIDSGLASGIIWAIPTKSKSTGGKLHLNSAH